MTIRSGDIAWRFLAVSSSDSPFSTALPLAAKLSESAESHFSAVSNEKRVRVEASKKRLTTIRPREGRDLLDRPLPDRAHGLRGVEEKRDLVGRQRLDPEQVLGAQARGRQAGLSRIQTSSAPSVSWKRTWMTSRLAVGTLLPT